jgi:putative zinc finger/helix-turn-helix YgiT family protein
MTEEVLPDVVCGSCGLTGTVHRFQRDEPEEIRGFSVDATKTVRRCSACGAEFENSQDPDWRPAAYAAFRKAKGWATPEQIVAWRRKYDLSQGDVARLLGWGEVTLGRYERGALQSEAHNVQLCQLMAEGGISRALAERPDALPSAKREAVRAALAAEHQIAEPDDIRFVRDRYRLRANEAAALVSAEEHQWRLWEAGISFPDARASRLIHLIRDVPGVFESLRSLSSPTSGVRSAPGTRRTVADAPKALSTRSPEARAFWSSVSELGFRSRKLRRLFPAWASSVERDRHAAVELGAFAQVHMGIIAQASGEARLMSQMPARLKATKHKNHVAHAAALAMTCSVARIVAKATTTPWHGSLPDASAMRARILRGTNRGWVNFGALAEALWASGIPVIYLHDLPVVAKGMDGMVTRAEGRPVIVLCKSQSLSDWMLFILGHEAGHIGCDHLAEEEGATVIDDSLSEHQSFALMSDMHEAEANEYSQRLLSEDGATFELKTPVPAESLADLAIQVGTTHRTSPGHVVLNAMRHTTDPPFNLAPLSMAALKIIDKRLGLPRTEETCRSLASAYLDRSRLRPDTVGYLERLGVL